MKTITFLTMGMLTFSLQVSVSQMNLQDPNNQLEAAVVKNPTEYRYYYYPNLEAYFDTQKGVYIFCEKGNWKTSEFLNLNTHGYSLKNGNYKKLKYYAGDEPYTLLKEHKLQYPADYSSKPKRSLISAVD